MTEPEQITEHEIDMAPDYAWNLANQIVLGNQGVGNAAVLIQRAFEERERKLRWALVAALEWIDAVPEEVVASLPAMPGFDLDYVHDIFSRQALATRQDAPKACSEDTSHDH